MREFFKPWRRKAGCVTLVMACVFMGVWVRSEITADWFYFSSGEFTNEGLISFRGNLICNRFRHSDKTGTPREVIVERGESVWEFLFAHQLSNDDPFEWQQSWNICGICKRETAAPEFRLTALTIPYWSIVVPLTLLSAYLLLSKLRRTTPKTGEPAPAEAP